MKKLIALLLMLCLLPCAAFAEEQPVDEMKIAEAVACLRQTWAEIYAGMETPTSGEVDILHARLVEIADDLSADEPAQEVFGEIDYLVEFVIYVDMAGDGYPRLAGGYNDTVAVMKDGTVQMMPRHPLAHYQAMTYRVDTVGIVEYVQDLDVSQW